MKKNPLVFAKVIIVSMVALVIYKLGTSILDIHVFLYNSFKSLIKLSFSSDKNLILKVGDFIKGCLYGYAELIYILLHIGALKTIIRPLQKLFDWYKNIIFYPFKMIFKKTSKVFSLFKKQNNTTGLTLKTTKKDIVIPNPFRGVLVIGGAGSGKSESFVVPFIRDFSSKNYSGICYDFKYPSLATEMERFYSKTEIKHFILNFNNPLKSHRCNPLNPKYLPYSAFAREYASVIIKNLMKESIKKEDFWSRSSIDLLTASIWFLRQEHPEYCDLPHALALISSNHIDLIELLCSNFESKAMILSLATALESEANAQLAGVVGSLQGAIAQINTPEFMYVFGGEDFGLDINNPQNPIAVTIGNNPALANTLAPLCSLVISVTAKQLNQPNKHHSFVLLDEFPTVFINDIQTLPNTGRSNKIASVFLCQDLAQLTDGYTKEKADVLFASCLNHFYGQVSSSHTADILSKQFGKSDQHFEGTNNSQQMLNPLKRNYGKSYSVQERDVFRSSRFMELSVGEFIGRVAEIDEPFVHEKLLPVKREFIENNIDSKFEFTSESVIREYYQKVRTEVDEIFFSFKSNKSDKPQEKMTTMKRTTDIDSETDSDEFNGISTISEVETDNSSGNSDDERTFSRMTKRGI